MLIVVHLTENVIILSLRPLLSATDGCVKSKGGFTLSPEYFSLPVFNKDLFTAFTKGNLKTKNIFAQIFCIAPTI